jgi:hypothetical protein
MCPDAFDGRSPEVGSVRAPGEDRGMAVPPIIFAVCLVVGAVGATVWLPALDAGPVGGLAFFTVCGLIGAGLGLIGLHVYAMIETAETGRFARGAPAPIGQVG